MTIEAADTTADRGAPPGDRPAWRSPAAWTLLLSIGAGGLAADLLTKWLAFRAVAGVPVEIDRADVLATRRLSDLIPPHEPVTVIPRLLEFTLVLNPGAVFGAGAGKRWLFITVTVVALGAAAWMFAAWTRARDRWAHAAIALIAAGGLGNLYDRLVYACVRDFIHPLPGVLLPMGRSWPNGSRELWPYVSNVADLLLLIGIGVLMVLLARGPGGSTGSDTAANDPPAGPETPSTDDASGAERRGQTPEPNPGPNAPSVGSPP